MINSEKGKELLQNISNGMHLELRHMEEIYAGNPYFMGQAIAHNNRKLFFSLLQNQPFSKSVKGSYTENMRQKTKRWIKYFLKHFCGRRKW